MLGEIGARNSLDACERMVRMHDRAGAFPRTLADTRESRDFIDSPPSPLSLTHDITREGSAPRCGRGRRLAAAGRVVRTKAKKMNLTLKRVESLLARGDVGKYLDRNGLYLIVSGKGAGHWSHRYQYLHRQ